MMYSLPKRIDTTEGGKMKYNLLERDTTVKCGSSTNVYTHSLYDTEDLKV